jgi:hypothetical protein
MSDGVVTEANLYGYQNEDRVAGLLGRYFGADLIGAPIAEFYQFVQPRTGLELLESKLVRPDGADIEFGISPQVLEEALNLLDYIRARDSIGGAVPYDETYYEYRAMAARMHSASDSDEARTWRPAVASSPDVAKPEEDESISSDLDAYEPVRERALFEVASGAGGLAVGAVLASSFERRGFPVAPATSVLILLGYLTLWLTAFEARRDRRK